LWPSTHLGQIALSATGVGHDGRIAWHAVVLAGFTLLFFLVARRRLARSG
jgi:membrane-anchored protein YejM (alkaline phosphatase superfamily)